MLRMQTRFRPRAGGGRVLPRRGRRGRGCSQPTAPRRGHRGGCAPPAARPPARRASTPSTPGAHVRLGAAPVCLEEAVGAVPRDEHRFRPAPDRAGQPRQPARVSHAGGLRQVVTGEPEPPAPGELASIEGEHHHPAGHAPHLAQPGDRILPVRDGAEGHRGIEGLVGERQALRRGGRARRRAPGSQRPHDRRRLHRGDVTAGRFIGASAGPRRSAPSARRRARPRPARRSGDRCAASPGTHPR